MATQLSGRPQVNVMMPLGSRSSTGITPVSGAASPVAVVIDTGTGADQVLPPSDDRAVYMPPSVEPTAVRETATSSPSTAQVMPTSLNERVPIGAKMVA